MVGFRSFLCAQGLLAASLTDAAPLDRSDAGSSLSLIEERETASSSSKLVFCHFMM